MTQFNHIDKDNVLHYFQEISKIPRGSGNEKAISDFLVAFAKEHGLFCRQDALYNVLIKKPGSQSKVNEKPIILQGHIDMVCDKNVGTAHDFTKDPIELVVKGDYIYANETTLGADNGIAVAYMMALLTKTDGVHPPIEGIFTSCEETGLEGAIHFDTSDIEGKRFINLDNEEEGLLLSGCSGGCRMEIALPLEFEIPPKDALSYTISITGLLGGHSGADIHLQRGNAIVILGRILYQLDQKIDFSVSAMHGGSMDNAICREAFATLHIPPEHTSDFQHYLSKYSQEMKEEYSFSDGNIVIHHEVSQEEITKTWSEQTKKYALSILTLLPYGVQTVVSELPTLVESSNNLGILETTGDALLIHNALRSSTKSRMTALVHKIELIGQTYGATVKQSQSYPGWKYNPNSELLAHFAKVYETMYEKSATISAIHAGLECGLFGEKIDGLDMISIGPEMHDIHTPQERVSISSTLRVWEFLLEALKELQD
ncbi:MAG: aminoacyl-histidine dipeptidase [Bacillota bacterium]